jgi:cbb3-type cytochrome oxidase cytochrome c subunit
MTQRVPRFVLLIVAVAVISLAVAVAVSAQVATLRAEEEERDCQRAVATRTDGRAMWLWIAGAYGQGNPQRTEAFLDELDRRLPELHCVDGDPIPVK